MCPVSRRSPARAPTIFFAGVPELNPVFRQQLAHDGVVTVMIALLEVLPAVVAFAEADNEPRVRVGGGVAALDQVVRLLDELPGFVETAAERPRLGSDAGYSRRRARSRCGRVHPGGRL